jgi:hypothetical protein
LCGKYVKPTTTHDAQKTPEALTARKAFLDLCGKYTKTTSTSSNAPPNTPTVHGFARLSEMTSPQRTPVKKFSLQLPLSKRRTHAPTSTSSSTSGHPVRPWGSVRNIRSTQSCHDLKLASVLP